MADFLLARPYILYFCLSLVFLLAVYLVGAVIYYLRFKKIKLVNFGFSLINYHIMVSGFLLGAICLSFLFGNYFYLALFIVFCLAGVVGETIFSIWWKIYFERPFWRYRAYPIANSFSSLLNFIPWGVGGFFFLAITQAYYKEVDSVFRAGLGLAEIFRIGAWLFSLLFFQFLIFKIIKKTSIFKKFKQAGQKTGLILLKYVFLPAPFF